MAGPSHIATLVDRFLTVEKRLLGVVATDRWRETHTPGEWKIRWPVMVGDEADPEHQLCLTVYPRFAFPTWHITLVAGRAIFRVDHVADDQLHVNSLNAADDIKGLEIWGPHFHGWSDNRRFCTANALPVELPNARPLPGKHNNFQNALRWFCGEARIVLPANDLIDLPKPSTLL